MNDVIFEDNPRAVSQIRMPQIGLSDKLENDAKETAYAEATTFICTRSIKFFDQQNLTYKMILSAIDVQQISDNRVRKEVLNILKGGAE